MCGPIAMETQFFFCSTLVEHFPHFIQFKSFKDRLWGITLRFPLASLPSPQGMTSVLHARDWANIKPSAE